MPDLDRRRLVGAVLTGAAGLPFAAILADPKLARAAAQGLEAVALTLPSGKKVAAVLAVPTTTPAPAVLLIHEFWGLNDQIKATAAEFAKEGYLALAVDLYEGRVASDRDTAREYMRSVDPAEATATLAAWIDWLKAHRLSTGKVATVGWCFGGGWSLAASLARPVDATVIYYGRVDRPAEELARLKGPVLGHFATRDQWINRAMVDPFEAAVRAAGKEITVHWYDADHAFANPTGARYDQEDAALAWRRTLDFLAAHLG